MRYSIRTTARIGLASVVFVALAALAAGTRLDVAGAEPPPTPGTAINFVVTGPGGPLVNVHNITCPAILVLASTGSATSCEFEIARTEPDEPSEVDLTVTAELADASPTIELDKFALDVDGGGSWGFTTFPQVIASEPSWPWSTTPWTFASTVSWTDLSNASLGGSVTLTLVIDLSATEATASPTPSPTASPTQQPSPTPSNSPTTAPSASPTPTPTLPNTGGTPTPTPTLPNTSLADGWPGSSPSPTGSFFLLVLSASVAAIAYLWILPRRRRRRDS